MKARCSAWTLLLAVIGCASQQPTITAAKLDASRLQPGMYCKIAVTVLSPETGNSHRGYAGTIAEVTPDEIVLKNAILDDMRDHKTSAVNDVPLVNQFFKKEEEQHELGTLRIPRAKITAIRICDPSGPPTDHNYKDPQGTAGLMKQLTG
jgi:hypothetical protein